MNIIYGQSSHNIQITLKKYTLILNLKGAILLKNKKTVHTKIFLFRVNEI